MLWRLDHSQNPPRHKWFGPLRVIIQDGNHTVWCTNAGKLYRGAPEHVRRAVPEEGQPDDPDLPEDLTQMHQQIQNMSRTEEIEQPPQGDRSPEIAPIEIPPLTPITEVTPPPSQTEESVLQPEPENEDPSIESQPSQASETNDDDQNGDDDDAALVNLICADAPCALQERGAIDSAWKCEFEVSLPCPLKEHIPDEQESCMVLACNLC